MNKIQTSAKVLIYLTLLFASSNLGIAQVQLLGTSPESYGFKSILWDTSGKILYYLAVDTSAYQCKLYNADDFSLAYTISGVDYPSFSLPDMNGNGHPELFFTSSPPSIVDAFTGSAIYTWPSNYTFINYFTTPTNSTIKIAFIIHSSLQPSSLAVYSLGITTSAISKSDNQLPAYRMKLEQNFPNPFNPITTIEYSIPNSDFVTLKVFDITGRIVRTILSENQSQGKHTSIWDGRNDAGELVSSGTYFYLVRTANSTLARKMIYLK